VITIMPKLVTLQNSGRQCLASTPLDVAACKHKPSDLQTLTRPSGKEDRVKLTIAETIPLFYLANFV